MTRYAIGDVQGCHEELQELVARVNFSADRDQLWFVGDLVNRGPRSLEVLRFVRDLADNAIVVLGNHDLHLLAVAHGSRRSRKSDTLDDVLKARDRDSLLEWLITRPLAHLHPGPDSSGQADLMVHAGLVPQWTVGQTLEVAHSVESSLRRDAPGVFAHMYGDEPDHWSEDLAGMDKVRFAINVLTRIRLCTADGRIELKLKGKQLPSDTPYQPWFDAPSRHSRTARVIFGHWSALGFLKRNGVVGLDSGCVWGGALTAFDLDTERPPITVPCSGYQSPDG
ncbi:MAG: symmetrical bis(5'-nucleosyl)-tetraphosphatase [Steroidobacteraceae bacterium]